MKLDSKKIDVWNVHLTVESIIKDYNLYEHGPSVRGVGPKDYYGKLVRPMRPEDYHRVADGEGVNAILVGNGLHKSLYLGDDKIYDARGQIKTLLPNDPEFFETSKPTETIDRLILLGSHGENGEYAFSNERVKPVIESYKKSYTLVPNGIPDNLTKVQQRIPFSCGIYCIAVAKELSKTLVTKIFS